MTNADRAWDEAGKYFYQLAGLEKAGPFATAGERDVAMKVAQRTRVLPATPPAS